MASGSGLRRGLQSRWQDGPDRRRGEGRPALGAATGRPLGPPLPHRGGVSLVDFSSDGRVALTGSSDNTARLWDVATGMPLGAPLRHQGFLQSAAFRPDGQLVLTGSYDRS